ncbi:unnamed protein product [Caretta caretta]
MPTVEELLGCLCDCSPGNQNTWVDRISQLFSASHHQDPISFMILEAKVDWTEQSSLQSPSTPPCSLKNHCC